MFENIGEHPQDTLNLAIHEEEAWRVANTKEDAPEDLPTRVNANHVPQESPICFIDGSWHESETRSGHRWLVVISDNIVQVGLKSSKRCLSPLHSELESLL